MLVPLQEKDFDKYIDFAYELALDPARCFYPVYFDGIKTKEYFIAKARRAFTRPTEEILLYQADGAVEGWLLGDLAYSPEELVAAADRIIEDLRAGAALRGEGRPAAGEGPHAMSKSTSARPADP